ncbi:MAG: undecaprenyl-diphosphatase [Actinomycetota bacterium]|jgi:undecaprenyl-diphosphatase|nr:undecaprenyl-diphosphatase [Actinomycetota bacterium]
MLTFWRAIVIGLLQGVTELFPVSSLGHSVLVPALIGWDDLVKAQSQGESFYLAFLVALHVGTALALLVYFRSEWIKIIGGLLGSVRQRRVTTPDARLGMLLIVATIPTGIVGLAFEHSLRTLFAKPAAAAIFLTINGVILLLGEALRRRVAAGAGYGGDGFSGGRRIESLSYAEAVFIGFTQIGSLFAGISRSGITMVGGLVRGLDHEDAARFSFLLATPIILAAGVYKLPDLIGHLGDGVRGQALVGAVVAAFAAYFSTRFLVRFFETQSLTPFGIYCLAAGAFCIVRFVF